MLCYVSGTDDLVVIQYVVNNMTITESCSE